MVRYLPILIAIALLLYTLIDAIGTDERNVRNLPKPLWLILILLIPIAGPIGWLIGGRPPRQRGQWPLRPVPEERPRSVAPDDDPEFLAKLAKDNSDNADFLKKWEDDLKRREQELRDPGEGDESETPKA